MKRFTVRVGEAQLPLISRLSGREFRLFKKDGPMGKILSINKRSITIGVIK